ncbi:hypothetical protein OA501_00755 [Flavobacteriaceae bacterium]|nr:hypothetical protein [Flavobacteriaceae bacterium]
MNNNITLKPFYTIESTSKPKAVISFYSDYLQFQLSQEHTPRKLFYNEVDGVIRKSNLKFLLIYSCFVLALVVLSSIRYQEVSIWGWMTNLCLVIFTVSTYLDRHQVLQLKRGTLVTEVFISKNIKEVREVSKKLNHYLTDRSVK